MDLEIWRAILSLTIEAITTQKGDITLSEAPRCGISQVKSQVQRKVCASSKKPRCDKSQSQQTLLGREIQRYKETQLVKQSQEEPRMLQNLVEDT